MRPPRFAATLWFLVCSAAAYADVTLAPLFTDHAVLQRDKPVPIWGRADSGEKITVTFGRQAKSTTTGPDGRWTVSLDKLSAESKGADLTVAGKNTLVAHDVVVGEVWLCSGQSNMEFPVVRAENAATEIASANFPLLRHLTIERCVAEAPTDSFKASGWKSATRENVRSFTAGG